MSTILNPLKTLALFHEADRQCVNYFKCTLPAFIRKITAKADEDGDNLSYALLIARTTQFHKNPRIAEKMDWELKGGKMPGQENYSQKEYDNVFSTQFDFVIQG